MDDGNFMKRALDLAARGKGSVSPNPRVGCVIVYENKIIGEGWHGKFGGPHAEVMAVESVLAKELLPKASFFITLEPCSYHGKTPACTDLIKKIKPLRVVVASLDPNPRVSGRGVELLKSANIQVEFGLMHEEAVRLNRRFFIAMNLKRPYIILKWAETADGFIAKSDYDSKWISNELSRQLVHKWRSEEDGILVGYNTVVHDNPQLNVRDWSGSDPIRIVIDKKKSLSRDHKVFDKQAKTYWLNTVGEHADEPVIIRSFSEEDFIEQSLGLLYEENIGSIIVEGGAATLGEFIAHGLWDEARIFTSTQEFEQGIPAPVLKNPVASQQMIQNDRLSIIYNPLTSKYWQKN